MTGYRDEKLLKKLGNNLKKIRLSKKLSIRKLAIEADMEYSTLHRIEKGQSDPSVSAIYALASALQIDPRELLPPL